MIDDATIAGMLAKHTYWCPTLTVARLRGRPAQQDEPGLGRAAAGGGRLVQKALAAGVPIVMGTDAGGFPWDEINEAEELRRYVALGMTPWQALKTTTVTAAELLGQAGTLGTVAPGAVRRPGGDARGPAARTSRPPSG